MYVDYGEDWFCWELEGMEGCSRKEQGVKGKREGEGFSSVR